MNYIIKTVAIIMVMLSTALVVCSVSCDTYVQVESCVSTKLLKTNSSDCPSISANDFCFAQRFGNADSIQSVYIYTIRHDKLLRTCIFDHYSTSVLTRTLTWYIHSTYHLTLSPKWCPSIPIAQRRLTI